MKRFTPIFMLLSVLAVVSPLAAQDSADGHSAAAAAANNPLANMTSFQLQNYYSAELYGLPDETSNTAWLRFVKPFGKVLVRASLPLSTVPTGTTESTSGLGDLNVFAAYLMTDPSSPKQYGIGPLVVAPTRGSSVRRGSTSISHPRRCSGAVW